LAAKRLISESFKDFIQRQYDEQIVPLMVQMVEEGKARGEISDKVSVKAVLEELIHIFFYGLCGREPQ
jgi:hypothetical protein